MTFAWWNVSLVRRTGNLCICDKIARKCIQTMMNGTYQRYESVSVHAVLRKRVHAWEETEPNKKGRSLLGRRPFSLAAALSLEPSAFRLVAFCSFFFSVATNLTSHTNNSRHVYITRVSQESYLRFGGTAFRWIAEKVKNVTVETAAGCNFGEQGLTCSWAQLLWTWRPHTDDTPAQRQMQC